MTELSSYFAWLTKLCLIFPSKSGRKYQSKFYLMLVRVLLKKFYNAKNSKIMLPKLTTPRKESKSKKLKFWEFKCSDKKLVSSIWKPQRQEMVSIYPAMFFWEGLLLLFSCLSTISYLLFSNTEFQSNQPSSKPRLGCLTKVEILLALQPCKFSRKLA